MNSLRKWLTIRLSKWIIPLKKFHLKKKVTMKSQNEISKRTSSKQGFCFIKGFTKIETTYISYDKKISFK